MFPDDATLIARGKYSTLTKERREQLERVQAICTTIITMAHGTLRDCEQKPPKNREPLETMKKCFDNLEVARERLITACLGMAELQEEAWPK